MSKSTLHTYWRTDNIRVISAKDTSVDTVQAWEVEATTQMESYNAPIKRLYDLRELKGVSIFAVRTAVKLKSHINTRYAFIAVITNNVTVTKLVNLVLSIQPGGNFFITTDEAAAISWLHNNVPDETQLTLTSRNPPHPKKPLRFQQHVPLI